MNNNISIDVQIRDVSGKKVKNLRKKGLLPAVIYGKGFDPISVQIDNRTFDTIFRQAGRTSLVGLNIPGQKPQSAFIKDVQRHPIGRHIIHADLHVVDLTIEMVAEIPIVLKGESPLVERGDANINYGLTSIEVRGLPAALPHHIEVDISGLKSLDKAIHVSDIALSGDYTVVTPSSELVVSLIPTRATEVEESAEQPTSIEPQLIRKEREEKE